MIVLNHCRWFRRPKALSIWERLPLIFPSSFVVEILLFPMFVIFFNLDVVEEIFNLLLIFFLATVRPFFRWDVVLRTDCSNSGA